MKRAFRALGVRALTAGLAVGVLGGAAAAASSGCTSSSSPVVYTPITGIEVRSSQLVGGHGCGTEPDQVYAYAVVLSYKNGPGLNCIPVDGGPNPPCQSTVTPCYADAVLSNLEPRVDGGQDYDFTLNIFAYNYESFPAALACTPPRPRMDCPGDDPSALTNPDAGDIEPRYPPSWKTKCEATELAGIPVLADCRPLEPYEAGADGGAGD